MLKLEVVMRTESEEMKLKKEISQVILSLC
jgi:hypothetical protein